MIISRPKICLARSWWTWKYI